MTAGRQASLDGISADSPKMYAPCPWSSTIEHTANTDSHRQIFHPGARTRTLTRCTHSAEGFRRWSQRGGIAVLPQLQPSGVAYTSTTDSKATTAAQLARCRPDAQVTRRAVRRLRAK